MIMGPSILISTRANAMSTVVLCNELNIAESEV